MGTRNSLLDTVDSWLGDVVDRAVCAHHGRRLRKPGRHDVRSPQHARAGNAVRVLVDGQEALAAMVAAIVGAKSHVHIAGWRASPDCRPTREPESPTMRELLAEVAEHVPVRLLLWAGPPLPMFRPTRGMVREACERFQQGTRVRCVPDERERTLHSHHEKIVVVDDEVAFVGGIDFTALSGDRHDGNAHLPDRSPGWHDAATELRGPIVADVATHFAQRWSEVAGEPLPEPSVPPAAGNTAVRLVRTVPERTSRFAPRGESSSCTTRSSFDRSGCACGRSTWNVPRARCPASLPTWWTACGGPIAEERTAREGRASPVRTGFPCCQAGPAARNVSRAGAWATGGRLNCWFTG